MKLHDILASTLVVWIWGINMIVVKLGVQELPPLFLTGLRFLLVAVATVPFLPLPRRLMGKVALLASVLGVGHFGLLFVGLHGVDAATAAIVIQLTVPFSAIIARFLYGERLGLQGGAGMILAFAGVALIAGEPTRYDMLSIGVLLLSALCWAASNVVVKAIGPINVLTLNGWMGLFAAPQLFILSALFEHGQINAVMTAGWPGWGAVAYTALISSLVAYSLWYWLIGRLPMNQVVPFTLLGPVISVVAGVTLLGEPLGWYKLTGGIVTVLGVALIQLRPARAGKAKP